LEDVLHPESVKTWRKEVRAWEANRSLPSPFAPKVAGMELVRRLSKKLTSNKGPTQASVRKLLAEAEEQEVFAGAELLHGDISPSALIALGIDLEEQQ
jgi:hypothetical protein